MTKISFALHLTVTEITDLYDKHPKYGLKKSNLVDQALLVFLENKEYDIYNFVERCLETAHKKDYDLDEMFLGDL